MASCIVTYQSSNGGDYVKLKLDWSYTNTATTATISATLSVCRDGYGPTMGNANYWVKVNGTEIFNSSTQNLTVGTSWVTVKSGSKTINLSSGGAQTTNLSMTAYYNQPISEKLTSLTMANNASTWTYNKFTQAIQSGALTATVPAQASACTAPTSVTLAVNGSSDTLIVPSGTIKVSWSGATAGTNNPITGYDVYYKIDGNPTTTSYTGKTSTDSATTSATFILSGATRGKLIYVGVVTKCNNSAYYSVIKNGGGNIRVNDLPAAPTLNRTSPFTLKSTSTGISVTATAGSVTYSKSTPAVKYRKNNNNPSGSTTFTKGTLDSGNYYFWTYDGLEYSSVKTLVINKNPTPTISSSTLTATNYIAKNANTYVYKVQIGNTTANFSSGKYTIAYQRTDKDWTNIVTNQTFSSSTFNPNYTFNFEDYLPATVSKDYVFKFRISITVSSSEGDETSGWWESGTYTYAGLWGTPELSTNPLPNFRATIQNDTRMTGTWKVTAQNSSGTSISVTSMSTSVNGNSRIFDITTADASGQTITYTIVGTNGTITKSKTFTRTLRQKSTITSVSFNNAVMSAFGSNDNTGTISVSGVKGNDFTSNLILTVYAVNGTTSVSVATINVGSGQSAYTNQTASISVSNFFNPGQSQNFGFTRSTWYGKKTFQFKASITNRYSEVITATTSNCSLDFDIKPSFNESFTSSTSIQYKNSAGESFASLGSHYVQEGEILRFKYNIKNYTYRDLILKIRRADNSSGTNAIDIITKTFSASAITSDAGETDFNGYFDTTYTVPEVTVSSYYWKISVTQSGTNSTIESSWISTNAILHTTVKNLSLVSIDPTNANDGYNIKFSYSSLGIVQSGTSPTRTAKVRLQRYNGTTWVQVGADQTISGSSPITITISGTVHTSTSDFRIVIITAVTQNGYISNTKNTTSNVKVVYIEEPLVAYRKNQLGIHTKSLENDAFLDIRTTENKETLYIKKGTDTMLKISFNGTDTTILDIP